MTNEPNLPPDDGGGDDLDRVRAFLDSGGADADETDPYPGGARPSPTPTPPGDQNLAMDSYDKRLFEEAKAATGRLRNMLDADDASDTLDPLARDLFAAFYKAQPDLLPEERVRERPLRANRPFLETLLEDPKTYETRATTTLDELYSTAAATAATEEYLDQLQENPDLAPPPAQPPEAGDAPDELGEEDQAPGGPDGEPPAGPSGRALRKAARAVADAAQTEAEDLADAMDSWGIEPADLKTVPLRERLELAGRLRGPDLRRLADLVGRMRNLNRAKAREKVAARRDEVHSVASGRPDDPARVLPSELSALASKKRLRRLDFLRRFVEGKVLHYELRRDDRKARGPIVALIDSCLTGETKVLGPAGARRMDELNSGDLVYSYVDGTLATRKVKKAWFTKRQDVFRVRTNNRALLASANHPFLRLRHTTKAPARTPAGRFAREEWTTEWARTDQLRRGDLVVTLRQAPGAGTPQTLSDGTPLTPEIAWLIGLTIGDGWIAPYGVTVCVYGECRDRVADICKRTWDANGSRNDTYGITINSARMRDVFKLLGLEGRRAHQKRVPDVIWRSPDDVKRAFLDGYAAADGYEGKDARTYASVSQDLISEVRMMHIALGDPVSNLSVQKHRTPRIIKGKLIENFWPCYRFGVTHNRARRGLSDGRPPAALRRFAEGPFAYQQVLSIEGVGERDTYDLEVEGSHNFVAEGMVVHNSSSMRGPRMEWATAVGLALADTATGKGPSGGRPCALVFFNTQIVREVFFEGAGARDPRKLLEAATVGGDGGTKYVAPIARGVEIVGGKASFSGADLVLVTDGECAVPDEFLATFLAEKKRLSLSLHSVLIGHRGPLPELARYSDEVHALGPAMQGAQDAASSIFERLA